MNLTSEAVTSELASNKMPDQEWVASLRRILLESAAKHLSGIAVESVTVSLEFTLSQPTTECIKVCVGDNHGNQICGCI